MKTCSKCGEARPLDFYTKGSNKDGLNPWCRPCRTEYTREYRKVKPPAPKSAEKARDNALKYYYGISTEQFNALLDAQGGVCAGCGADPSKSSRNFCIDHDHSCCPGTKTCGNCIRGILCGGCNTALGHMQDDPEKLERLANYARTCIMNNAGVQ